MNLKTLSSILSIPTIINYKLTKLMNIEGTAFEVIAKVNNLTHIKDNIYQDNEGNKYYLDNFGFHTALIQSNHEIIKERRKVLMNQKYVNKQINVAFQENTVGRKTKNRIMGIIAVNSDTEAIELIKQYLNK